MIGALLLASVALNGLLAGMSLDQSIKQVPSRRRIGNRSYAVYTRGADLGAGLAWYIVLPNLAVLATLAAAAMVWFAAPGSSRARPAIALAALLSIAHSLATARAAPTMWRSRNVPLDDEPGLATLFGRFERWQGIRAVLQVATFACALWALTEANNP